MRAASACLLPADRKDAGQVSVRPPWRTVGVVSLESSEILNSRLLLIEESFGCFLFQIGISRFNVNR